MSTEVDNHEYQHNRTSRARKTDPTLMDFLNDFTKPPVASETAHTSQRPDRPTTAVFRYNPLHDLESLFWLCFFLLLAATFKNNGKYTLAELSGFRAAQVKLYNQFFYSRTERSQFMFNHQAFATRIDGLHPTVVDVMLKLDEMRSWLIAAFEDAEGAMDADNPIPFSVGEKTGSVMGGVVKEIQGLLMEVGDLQLIVEEDLRPQAPKRPTAVRDKAAKGAQPQLAPIQQEAGEAAGGEGGGRDDDKTSQGDDEAPAERATRSRAQKDLGPVRRSARLVDLAAKTSTDAQANATGPADGTQATAPAPKKKAGRGRGRGGKRGGGR